MSDDLRRNEEGVALLVALFSLLVLGTLVVLFTANVLAEQRASQSIRNFENALATVEVGTDRIISIVNEDSEFVTRVGDDNVSGNSPHTLPSDTSDDSVENWIVSLAESSRGDPDWSVSHVGEVFAVRPLESDGSGPAKEIVAVSYVPGFDGPNRRVRVVRIIFDDELFVPNSALLTGCDENNPQALILGGDSTVGGVQGHVHSNCSIDNSGTSFQISGDLSSTREVADAIESCSTCVGGAITENGDEIAIPEIVAREQWKRRGEDLAASPEGTEFHLLCPDGTIRRPPDGDWDPYTDPGAMCASTDSTLIVWQSGGIDESTNNYNGWKFSASSNVWSGQQLVSGAYYVYRSDATFTGTEGSDKDKGIKLSVIAEADPSAPGGSDGSIEMGGNVKADPALASTLFIADRDIKLQGTPGTTLTGFAGAHEQVDARGNASMTGAIVAEEAPHTSGSPVSQSRIGGNFNLTYDEDLDVFLSGIVRVVAWDEL